MKSKNFGFTMIELLIVIAVLGILATAVLSAINPIEQIDRGRDTGSRSDAEQLLSAIDRFYASQGYYPWQTRSSDIANLPTVWGVVDKTTWTDGVTPVLTKLSASLTGEIKSSFVNRLTANGYNTLYKYNRGTAGDSTYLCFLAKSGSFKTEANKRCSVTGLETGDPNGGGLPPDIDDTVKQTICVVVAPYVCLP